MKEEVLRAEQRWAKAFLELDIETIAELMDDDYTLIQQDGSIVKKEQVLLSLRSQQRNWESVGSNQHDIRMYGDVAVVIAHWQSKGTNHGKFFDYAAHYMAVWVKRKEGWRIAADQSTPISVSTPNYWLFKSEPDEFSFDDLLKKSFEPWTGVRNYQARNFLRDNVKLGDNVLFYHSSTTIPAVVGIAKVIRPSYPDPTQFDKKSKYYDAGSKTENPRWVAVDIKAIKALNHIVTLKQMKSESALQNMRLVKHGNRLSVMPVSKEEFNRILDLSGARDTTAHS